MSKNNKLIQFLNKIAHSNHTFQLQISNNSLIWKLQLIEGKLDYATYSLQSWGQIKNYLLRFSYDAALQIDSIIIKDISPSHELINQVIKQLVKQKYLKSDDRARLMRRLTEDAVESLLSLTQGKYVCQKNDIKLLNNQHMTPIAIPSLLESLQNNLQTWQKLSPFIDSPYQRPYLAHPSLFQMPVQSTSVSSAKLKHLLKFMPRLDIRQLGFLLKQDELKMAQFLLPYLKLQILQLHPPLPPLNEFFPNSTSPKADGLTFTSPINTSQFETLIQSNQTSKKLYKIACIDDSPAIIDMIQSYLGTDQYEIFPIDTPMKSIPLLFDKKPDLILMDWLMPGINGDRLCKILRSSPVFKNIPIIIVSGNSAVLNQDKVADINANDYLAKPFSKNSLQEMVKKYLKVLA